jgi:Lar family restriction alleviation protein
MKIKCNGVEVKTKPCPFCGSEKLKLESKNGSIHYYEKNGMKTWQNVKFSVRCNSCHARGGVVSEDLPTDDSLPLEEVRQMRYDVSIKAIEKWNRRCD